MGVSKVKDYNQNILEFSRLTKALGHPARMTIVEHLAKSNKCITDHIVNELPLSQSTVSQHLRELKAAGLVNGEIEGNAVCYCLNIKAFERWNQYCALLLQKIHQNNCC
ncbi:MAG: metalloregulator ArsR/SmtB family transcription factor [Saprospiraceae bacterium]